jgi:copper(I)-binding protein
MTSRNSLLRGKAKSTGHGTATLTCLALLSAAPFAHAQELLHWKDIWVRSMPPGAEVTAAYGQLMNHGDQPVMLSGITSEVGTEAQMHDVIADGDQRRMVQLTSVEIAPHETLVFAPGGRHIMLLNVTSPPAEGTSVEICAVSAAGSKACTQAPVQRQAPMDHMGHHH